MTTWALEVLDMAGGTVLADAPFGTLHASWERNEPGALDADFALSAVSFSDLNPDEGREVKLLRNGTAIAGGYAERVEFDTRGDKRVKLLVPGYLARLDAPLHEDLTFNAIAQQDICWALIDSFQSLANGSYGFVQGAHAGSTVVRSVEYCAAARPKVLDEIARFAEFDNGLDYEIDPATKAFNTWSPERGVAYGGTIGSDLMQVTGGVDLADVANYVSAIGSDQCGPVIGTAASGTSGARIGRRDFTLPSSHSHSDELASEAAEYLRAHKDGAWSIHVTYHEGDAPGWDAYGLGDTVTLDLAKDFATFTKTLRLLTRSLTIQQPATAVPPATSAVFWDETFESAL